MADEVAELDVPIVTQDPPVVETPKVVTQEPILEEPKPVHPLEPGGKRFEQVYAQSKQAQRSLEEERERRIRAEAQLEVLSKGAQPQEKEYSWDDLEVMISQGQITRSQANAHREEVSTKKLAAKLKSEFRTETDTTTRVNTLTRSVYDYVQAVPDLNSVETPIRQRVDKEFDWLVAVQGKALSSLGVADVKALELTALRNVLGPIESLAKRNSQHVETHQGFSGVDTTVKKVNPDQKILDDLTPREVTHYRRMMTMGKYPGGWKDVVAEMKFVPPARRV